jgi:hypothetical protein
MKHFAFNATAFLSLALGLFALTRIGDAATLPLTTPLSFDPETPVTLEAVEYEPLRVTLLGFDPQLNRIYTRSVSAFTELNLSFNNFGMVEEFPTPPAPRKHAFDIPGLAAGLYVVNLRFPDGTIKDTRQLRVAAKGRKVSVQTYAQGGAQAFTLAASEDEADRMLEIAIPSDSAFLAWSAAGDAPRSARAIQRLRYTGLGASRGFYFTDDLTEIARLTKIPNWSNEGVAFYLLKPQYGTCAFGTDPVYRAFRQFPPSHRYTTHSSAYQSWIKTENWIYTGAWIGEGIVFCAPTE